MAKEDFANTVPFTRLPEPLRNNLSTRKRGPQKAPTKQLISVRFSTEVIERFRASGQGWQTRMDLALQDWLETHDPQELASQ
ncbi:MAG: BrnA antitoxin family protein [Pseudomonadales bacterium]